MNDQSSLKKNKRTGRVINSMLKEIAERNGLKYATLSDGYIQVLSRIDHEKQELEQADILYVYGSSFNNNYASHSICNDKASLSAVLDFHGIPNVPHSLVYSPVFKYTGGSRDQGEGTMPGLTSMLTKWSRYGLVIKQKDGTQGIDVFRIRNQRELECAWLDMLTRHKDFVVSPFIPLQNEWRVVMVDKEVRLCYRKVRSNPEVEWRHNLSLGATVDRDVPAEFIKDTLFPLALKAVTALGIRHASVDIVKFENLTDEDKGFDTFSDSNGFAVLEVNAGIMLSGYAKRFPEEWDRCRDIYEKIVTSYFDK